MSFKYNSSPQQQLIKNETITHKTENTFMKHLPNNLDLLKYCCDIYYMLMLFFDVFFYFCK
jgi:hypothetical protein